MRILGFQRIGPTSRLSRMATIHRTVSLLFTALVLVAAVGCTPEWQNNRTYPSPGGEYVAVVTTELQGANDPEPWWQHVSIYRSGDEKKDTKGNLFVYSSHKAAVVNWTGSKELVIHMDDVSYTFHGPFDSRLSRELSITGIVKQPARGR